MLFAFFIYIISVICFYLFRFNDWYALAKQQMKRINIFSQHKVAESALTEAEDAALSKLLDLRGNVWVLHVSVCAKERTVSVHKYK